MNKQTWFCAVVSAVVLMAWPGAAQAAEIVANGGFGPNGTDGVLSPWMIDFGTGFVAANGNCATSPILALSLTNTQPGQASQTTDWVIGALDHYAFSVDTSNKDAGNFYVTLYADNLGTRTPLVSTSYASGAVGWAGPLWVNRTLSYDVPSASAYIGQKLGVQIGGDGWAGAGGIDNVSVNATIPEPSALMMLGVSLTGLLGSARRKRL